MPEAFAYITVLLQLVGMTAAFYIVVTGLRDQDKVIVMLGILIGVLIASGLFLAGVVLTVIYAGYGFLALRRQKTRNHDRLEP